MKNNRKNKMKPKYLLIVLVLVCIACIGLSVFSGFSGSAGHTVISYLLSPMQSGINSIGGLASNFAEKKQTADALKAENEDLSSQIDILQSQLTAMENNLSEYDELLSQLELSKKYPSYDMTAARIISKEPGNWYNTFTINKGSLSGIQKDMNVIAGNGLVGIVTQVDATTAVVRSIIDDNSSVSGMLSKNFDICIVNGDLTLMDSGLINVELISKDASVIDGDEVVTSYISDKYLPGILIGYISDITIDESELTYNAKLTPVVDFQHLSTVLVIKQLKADELSENAAAAGNDSVPATEDNTDTTEADETTETAEE